MVYDFGAVRHIDRLGPGPEPHVSEGLAQKWGTDHPWVRRCAGLIADFHRRLGEAGTGGAICRQGAGRRLTRLQDGSPGCGLLGLLEITPRTMDFAV